MKLPTFDRIFFFKDIRGGGIVLACITGLLAEVGLFKFAGLINQVYFVAKESDSSVLNFFNPEVR